MFSTRHSGLDYIMIWGASSFNGTMALQVVQGCQTAAGYVEMLQRASLMSEGLIHAVMTRSFNRTTLQFKTLAWRRTSSRRMTLRFWIILLSSPDLNSIENIWGWMAREVYKNGRQFQTVDAFCEAIYTTRSNVPSSLLEKLTSDMSKLIFEAINKNDGALQYWVLFWYF